MTTGRLKTLRSEQSVERFLAHRVESSVRVWRVETFEDAGVLSNNRGIVITTPDGREFQVNIVRSR